MPGLITPSLAQTHLKDPRGKHLYSPPEPPRPPRGVTQACGCSRPSQRQQHPWQLHGVVPVGLDALPCSAHPIPLPRGRTAP